MPPLWQPQHALLLAERYGLRPSLGSGVYPTGLRAWASAGDGQSAVVSSLNITIPTTGIGGDVQAGDVAVIAVMLCNTLRTLTTPTGWTLQANDAEGATTNTWIFSHTIAPGEQGTAVTLAFSGTTRVTAQMAVTIGGNESSLVVASTVDTGVTGTTVVPTLAAPDNSLGILFELRRNGTTPATPISEPSDWVLQDTTYTAYGSANEMSLALGVQYNALASSLGGNTYTPLAGAVGSVGAGYAIAVPLTVVSATASGTITLAGTGSAAAAPTAAGQVTLAGSGTAVVSGSATGTVTLAGAGAAVASAAAAGSVTLAGTGTASGQATATGSVTLGGTGIPAVATTASGSITLAGSGTTQAPVAATGAITLAGSATAAATATAAGALTLTGSATGQASTAAAGTITLSGTATAAGPGSTAAGSITLTGTASTNAGTASTGTVTLGGIATATAGAATTGILTLAGAAQLSALANAAGAITLAGLATSGAGLRDITLNVGPVETRTLAGSLLTRSLTGSARTRQTTPGDLSIRATTGDVVTRTLTGHLEAT